VIFPFSIDPDIMKTDALFPPLCNSIKQASGRPKLKDFMKKYFHVFEIGPSENLENHDLTLEGRSPVWDGKPFFVAHRGLQLGKQSLKLNDLLLLSALGCLMQFYAAMTPS
jgi:hypothetical protein